MKAYFPIPPNIKIKNFKNKIYGSITFLNIPNNRVKPIFFKYINKNIFFVGIYKLKNKSWVLLNLKKCKPYEFLEISRKDFNVKDNEMIIAVVKKSNSFESYSNILPPPDSLKIDNSLVAQRVSFNFLLRFDFFFPRRVSI